MFSNAHFSAQNLFLAPDEALLVYTDGATEAQDRSGSEFGIERLKALASRHVAADPETLITDCLESLKRFAAGRPFRDDFTMLAISRRS
jgi:sigma-B regulation protein RsbU (phosphoserine phosphatase)